MSATWPNEPSGANQWFNSDMSSMSGLSDVYNSTQIVSDGTAPLSPPNVALHRLEAFAKEGGGQVHFYDPVVKRDMFVGMYWRINAGFQGRQVTNKMFFVRGPGCNGVFGLLGTQSEGFWLYFSHNSAGLDNSHTMGGGGLIGYPNVGSGAFSAGVWHRIEAYIKSSTTDTSRDGIVKWWVDGVPTGSYTDVNYAQNGLNEWVWTQTWDGSGDMGTANTVAWEHYIDHLYIATGGTVGSGGGPPPPPPDPPPPTQVVLSSLTPANLSTVVGTSKQFTISMSGAVQTATSLFTTSSQPSVATVPASVTIPAGASTALVTATPVAVGSTSISTSYNGVTKAAALQVGTAGTTTGSTVYDYSLQFSGTQGSNGWYYLEDTGTQMTYNGGSAVWVGTDTYGGSLQTIWSNGFHPGGSRATMLRFVVPTTGSATITGSYVDVDTAGGDGVIAKVNHNGVTIFSRTINNGDTTGGSYSLSPSVAAGDYLDFAVSNRTANYSNNSTSLNPIITLSTTSTVPTPPPDPPAVISVVDLFTSSSVLVVGVPFTMTVRVSQIVTAATSVEIRVGSERILDAPTSATVASGSATQDFTVTPLAPGLVAVDAVLNGTKRVTLTIQPAPSPDTPPPVVDPGPPTDPGLPTLVTTIRATADGAVLDLNQGALALAFRYDAQADFLPIADYQANATTYTHRFTWPSGTTTICYRAQALTDSAWGPSACQVLPPPLPPPPPPPVNKAVRDKYGINWQLSGKKSPYELKRNGETMDNTYGVTLRKSGDGYLEILQPNGVWLRRNGDSWEFVA